MKWTVIWPVIYLLMVIHVILIRVKSAQTGNSDMAETSGNWQTSGLKIWIKARKNKRAEACGLENAKSQSISGRVSWIRTQPSGILAQDGEGWSWKQLQSVFLSGTRQSAHHYWIWNRTVLACVCLHDITAWSCVNLWKTRHPTLEATR